MVAIPGGNRHVSTCRRPSAPSPEPAAASRLRQRLFVIKMLRLAPLSLCNLDVAYTWRKVFEERLAGLGKVHICSASLLVFKTPQPRTTQEAQESEQEGRRGGGGAGRKAVGFSTLLESNANLRTSAGREFPSGLLQFVSLALFFLAFLCDFFSPREHDHCRGQGCQGQNSAFWFQAGLRVLPRPLLVLGTPARRAQNSAWQAAGLPECVLLSKMNHQPDSSSYFLPPVPASASFLEQRKEAPHDLSSG